MRIKNLGLLAHAGLMAALVASPALGRIVLTGEPRNTPKRQRVAAKPAPVEAEPLNPSRQVRRAKERAARKRSD